MSIRLSRNILPTHYNLTIQTDLLANPPKFAGNVIIDVNLVDNVSEILLHAGAKLQIAHLEIKDIQSNELISGVKVEHDKEAELLHITTDSKREFSAKRKLSISVCFQSVLNVNMVGYYLSSYKTSDVPKQSDSDSRILDKSEKVNYALTQFEPVAARSAFPCFDEPSFKATQQITLVSRAGTVNVSNMPIVESIQSIEATDLLFDKHIIVNSSSATPNTTTAWHKTVFEVSPPMSTYLFAWANGNFCTRQTQFKSPITNETKVLRIYATPDIEAQTQYAIDTLAELIPLYENAFKVPYTLPKCDTLVAHDFDAGAMENWGLITGRTSVYCYTEGKSGIEAKMRTAAVQSHECAHMWFGDLTTMKWWDNLWLNESFATIVGEYIILEQLYPDWQLGSSFMEKHLQQALTLDALPSSHPVEQPCHSVEMISQIFDAISYAKGASVLRMLSSMVSQDVFLKGVSLYLQKHAFKNTSTSDLWDSISEVSGLNLKTIMTNWVSKIGFPVVKVEEVDEGIKVSQERFLSTRRATEEEDQTIWYIPLGFKTFDSKGNSEVHSSIHLKDRQTIIPLKNSKSTSFKLNADTSGVFRVNYSPERLQKIVQECVKGLYSRDDRIGLVFDAQVLAKAGWAKTSTNILQLCYDLRNEEEYWVWSAMSQSLAQVEELFSESEEHIRAACNKFRAALFVPLVKKLGWKYRDSESLAIRQLRTLAITNAVSAGDSEVLKEYRRIFAKIMDGDDSETPADLERSIYANCVKFGGVKEYEWMLERYASPPTPACKVSTMVAMASTRDPKLIERTLALILSDILLQDYLIIFPSLAHNSHARRMLWKWTQDNFSELQERFKGNFSLGRIIASAFTSLKPNSKNEDDLQSVTEFFSSKDISSCKEAISQGFDRLRVERAWFNRDKEDIKRWLQENNFL